MADSWSNIEVELIVSDYFNMLSKELTRKVYSKSEHRKYLLPLLSNRSEGSIEFKHQNISAVLINLGKPYIKGYLPRFNYQGILNTKVVEYLNLNLEYENQFLNFADKEILKPKIDFNFDRLIVDPPLLKIYAAESAPTYNSKAVKINYLEREQRNQSLGNLGEELVLEYEKWKLIQIGKEKLAEQVRWIAHEEGDGAGFDILSKNLNGTDKYIEVKTTKLGKETPFFFSRNELNFSIEKSENYHLFRLFNFEEQAKLFVKSGNLNTICHSVPMTFKGYF